LVQAGDGVRSDGIATNPANYRRLAAGAPARGANTKAAMVLRCDYHHCFLGLNSTRPITSPKRRSTAASRKSAVSVCFSKSRKSCRSGWGGSGEELRSGCMDASWSCYRANSTDIPDSTAYRSAWADAWGAETGSGKVVSISSSAVTTAAAITREPRIDPITDRLQVRPCPMRPSLGLSSAVAKLCQGLTAGCEQVHRVRQIQ
jgi:hypothetical protein